MANSYKFVKLRSGLCAVQHKEPTLFGDAWVTVAAFKACEVRMKMIAKLLNECEKISEKYDTTRHIET